MPGIHHKALFLTSNQGPFEIGDNETPKPGPGELLVRIEASALNPLDWKIHTYGTIGTVPRSYPAILGTDIAGVVDQVGEGVSGFSKGDRIMYQASWTNDKMGYQQYNLVEAKFSAKIPSNVSFEEAASLPSALVASVAGLYAAKPHGAGLDIPLEPSARGKYAGKPLLVLGGASSLGQTTIQFARLSGFSPIFTTASPKHTQFLKSLGATHILDRTLPPAALAASIASVTTGRAPLEVVFDAISLPETQQTGYDLVADGGHLVLVLPETLTRVEGRNVTAGFIYGTWENPLIREAGVALHAQLEGLLVEGLIKPNRVEVLPGGLRGVVGGLERLKSGQVSGTKLIVRPQETV